MEDGVYRSTGASCVAIAEIVSRWVSAGHRSVQQQQGIVVRGVARGPRPEDRPGELAGISRYFKVPHPVS